ncbi:hypothetical protein HanRHA438_Chr14g0649921 [Helianthus annuus]|nr:hypothetical protein HanRHA438_Chr14g0649921 [Helianthus annuus]
MYLTCKQDAVTFIISVAWLWSCMISFRGAHGLVRLVLGKYKPNRLVFKV